MAIIKCDSVLTADKNPLYEKAAAMEASTAMMETTRMRATPFLLSTFCRKICANLFPCFFTFSMPSDSPSPRPSMKDADRLPGISLCCDQI